MFKNNLLGQARPYRRKDSKTALVNSDLFRPTHCAFAFETAVVVFQSYKKQKESKSKDRFLSVISVFGFRVLLQI